MSEGVDKDAVRAWAGALSAGLGLVRFSDLPKPVFDRLLSSAAYQGRDLHVVIAENATQEGLDELALEFFEDTAVMEAVEKRRVELLGEGNVVAFPSQVAMEQTAHIRKAGLWSRLVSLFDEEATAFDSQDGLSTEEIPAIPKQLQVDPVSKP